MTFQPHPPAVDNSHHLIQIRGDLTCKVNGPFCHISDLDISHDRAK